MLHNIINYLFHGLGYDKQIKESLNELTTNLNKKNKDTEELFVLIVNDLTNINNDIAIIMKDIKIIKNIYNINDKS